jgi:opacity protein-like surface antigen
MLLRPAVLVAALIPFLASPAVAQKLASPLSFTVFAGAAIPIGSSSDDLNTGYTVGGAVDLRVPATPLGGRLEGSYSRFGAKGLSGTGVSAKGTDLGANLNLVLWMPMSIPSPITPYLTAGPSFSRLEASASQGGATLSAAENHWGFNAGGGIDVGLGALAVRIDARYKRISTDSDSFQSIPITFGIRF